jgi:Flp pilus assembly protein TadB
MSKEEITHNELRMLIEKNAATNQLQHEALLANIQTFHDATNKTLDTILSQTTKTNGRVNKLENKNFYIAGIAVIITMVGLPMLWMHLNDLKDLKKEVNSHIAQTVSLVNIK